MHIKIWGIKIRIYVCYLFSQHEIELKQNIGGQILFWHEVIIQKGVSEEQKREKKSNITPVEHLGGKCKTTVYIVNIALAAWDLYWR